MRYVRYAVLAVLAVAIIVIALANRGFVTLRLLPPSMSGFLGWSWSITLPLFLVILSAVVAGLIVGFVWEWLRESRIRSDARHQRREKERLAREVREVRAERRDDDDVLALLEDRSAPR
jgi:uncharacterized integral membrane protein